MKQRWLLIGTVYGKNREGIQMLKMSLAEKMGQVLV